MNGISIQRGQRNYRRIALLVSVTLHAAIAIVFWRPAKAMVVAKNTPPTKADVVFLIASPQLHEREDSPIASGRIEVAQPKQSLIPDKTVGPKKSAILQTVWMPGEPSKHPAPKATSFFGVPTKGRRIVFVLDCSASMGRTGAYAAAKRELTATLERLPTGVRFQIIVYNNTPHLLFGVREWIEATPEAIRKTAEMLSLQIAEGGTDHLKALEKALWLDGDELFLLTDAVDFSSDHLRRATLRNRDACVIHVIRMGNAEMVADDGNWRMLAEHNNGVFHVVKW